MDAKRAAEVLGLENDPSATELAVAAKLGAEALEAWAWAERRHPYFHFNDDGSVTCAFRVGARIDNHYGHTPLASVLDAMQKEKV